MSNRLLDTFSTLSNQSSCQSIDIERRLHAQTVPCFSPCLALYHSYISARTNGKTPVTTQLCTHCYSFLFGLATNTDDLPPKLWRKHKIAEIVMRLGNIFVHNLLFNIHVLVSWTWFSFCLNLFVKAFYIIICFFLPVFRPATVLPGTWQWPPGRHLQEWSVVPQE